MFVVHVWQTWQEALEWNYGAFIIETLCHSKVLNQLIPIELSGAQATSNTSSKRPTKGPSDLKFLEQKNQAGLVCRISLMIP
jgi:hypothetical protein